MKIQGTSPRSAPSRPEKQGTVEGPATYKIQKGDTLSALARKFKTTVGALLEANPQIKDPNLIREGAALRLPEPTAEGPWVPSAGKARNRVVTRGPQLQPKSPPLDSARGERSVSELERQASSSEAQVMSDAKALASADAGSRAEIQARLSTEFASWKGAVDQLTAKGAFDSPAVKEFAIKTQQPAVLAQNLPAGTSGLEGPAYLEAAKAAAAKVFYAPGQSPEALVDANPLLGIPPLTSAPSLAEAKSRGVPTVNVTVDGKPAEVRRDVAVVFAPGIARTANDFGAQKQAALQSGLLPIVAKTTTFEDPDSNAQAVAQAIREAKAQLGNPNAKVILVGYSQGATDLLDLMRDKSGQFADVRGSVAAIHTVHSAAGGSQAADWALAMANYLTGSAPVTPSQQTLIQAFERAAAKSLGLPPQAADGVAVGLAGLKDAIGLSERAVRDLESVAEPVLRPLGLCGLTQPALGKVLLGAALAGRDLSQEAGKIGGPAGKWVSQLLYPVWNAVLSAKPRELLSQGKFGDLWNLYTRGGLESLTPEYGQALLHDPLLAEHLKGVPVINSAGAVPPSRESELVPPSQRIAYDFFQELGLPSDFWVALPNQEAAAALPTGIQLAPEAVGHFGGQGVAYADGTQANFSSFSPGGWMKALLATDSGLGIL